MDRRRFLTKAAMMSAVFSTVGFADEKVLSPKQQLITDIEARLQRVSDVVGFGNFNIISFDEVLQVARNFSSVGRFTKEELAYIEEIFYEDPRKYGFYGLRTCNDLTQPIYEKDVYKVPRSAHYIFKDYLPLYERLVEDVGDTLILTSGVRSVPKQLHLFLNRVIRSEFDFYDASYSLAPPGYSYHSAGDFDVGKVGFGWGNFSSRFAQTEEFKRLKSLPYVDIRYFEGNKDGVRYEPWHIQVI